jgi:hypothetical protein
MLSGGVEMFGCALYERINHIWDTCDCKNAEDAGSNPARSIIV